MNYKLIHDSIIQNAQKRVKPEGYTEVHHIIPKSFGGHKTDPANLVILTGREHFVIHQLLAKMHPQSGMIHAAYKMACSFRKTKKVKITSHVYETLRKAHAININNPETNLKKSKALKGRKQTPEHIFARTQSRKNNGKSWISEETAEKMSKALTGKKQKTVRKGEDRTEKQKLASIKSAETRRGRKMLPEQVAKSAASRRGKKRNVVLSEARREQLRIEKSKLLECPHCSKVGALMIMKRWHFDNCKLKT